MRGPNVLGWPLNARACSQHPVFSERAEQGKSPSFLPCAKLLQSPSFSKLGGPGPLKATQAILVVEKCRERLSPTVGWWPCPLYRVFTFPDLAAAAVFLCWEGKKLTGAVAMPESPGEEGICPPAHGVPHRPVSLQPGCLVLVAGEERGPKAMF